MASSHPLLLGSIVDALWNNRPESVLDVGMGFGKVGFLTREYLDVYVNRTYSREEWRTDVDGIEIWPDFVTDVHRGLYDEIHIGNAIDVIPNLGRYDLTFIMDVIEHLSKEDGRRLIDLARAHSKKVIVSTPAFHIDQDDIFGNPHERHISDWTAEDLGTNCKQVGPLLVAEIDGVDGRNVNIVTEGKPGWALRHLSDGISDFLQRNGRNVEFFDWASDDDISRVRGMSSNDATARFYVSTGPSAEIIHRAWGVPRERMYFLFHSVDDILEFIMRFEGKDSPSFEERDRFIRESSSPKRSEVLIKACSMYSGVGYLSHEQGEILRGMGVTDAFHVPQYVDVDNKFVPDRPDADGRIGVGKRIRIGAALATVSHPVMKGVPLLSEIVGMIREREDDMEFDARAVRGPGGNLGVAYDEMRNYMNSIDVLICTANSEGGPLPPLQAAACGIPTISTRCGHMPEFVIDGETGFLVGPDPVEFIEALERLSHDRGLLEYMGAMARKNVVENWSIESNGGKWIEMLEGLR